MENPSIFRNLSPLDHRYYLANRELFDRLSDHLSEDAVIRTCLQAEAALLKSHVELHGLDLDTIFPMIDAAVEKSEPGQVYEEEEKTQHNIRALVHVMKRYLPDNLKPFVHLGATSVDILDTAAALRVRGAVREVILPLLIEVENLLVDLAETEAATPQVGRTHGQHAVPITYGFAVAEYVSRFGKCILRIESTSANLRGKLGGAVGAYNSSSMLTSDPEKLERRYLSFLGLDPSEHSTQMVEPEYQLRLLTEINIAFGVLANLADDLRNLQRSEIDEVRESFSATQVGSSTMPQKRNPWNSEHIKSLWKAFAPRIQSFYMDQISEHQRDLTNSASARFVADYLAGFAAAAERTKKVLKSLAVNRERMAENISSGGGLVLAEAAYILLAAGGESEAHEVIRQATLACERNGTDLATELRKNEAVWKVISDRLQQARGLDADEFFSNPSLYRGLAEEKARSLAARYRGAMLEVTEKL